MDKMGGRWSGRKQRECMIGNRGDVVGLTCGQFQSFFLLLSLSPQCDIVRSRLSS